MFKLIFRYTFTGLFVSHFAMLCMLITKFAYEVRGLIGQRAGLEQ